MLWLQVHHIRFFKGALPGWLCFAMRRAERTNLFAVLELQQMLFMKESLFLLNSSSRLDSTYRSGRDGRSTSLNLVFQYHTLYTLVYEI